MFKSNQLQVEIKLAQTEGSTNTPTQKLIKQWATAAYIGTVEAQVSLYVTNKEEIKQLNKQYRAINKATNVLSFPMQTPEITTVNLLGDIVVCASIINQEAIEQSKKNNAHWAHMIIHSMLHLQGYDHIKDEQTKKMEAIEIELLQQLGINNPYIKL